MNKRTRVVCDLHLEYTDQLIIYGMTLNVVCTFKPNHTFYGIVCSPAHCSNMGNKHIELKNVEFSLDLITVTYSCM